MTLRTETSPATLLQAYWPRGTTSDVLRAAALILVGSLLLIASAKLRVPMWPVPATMQTFAVLAIGAAYGWRLGASTVAVYLAYGAVGIPVFGGTTAGPAYFAGPTAGYLVGFVVAAALVGWLAERGWDRRWSTTASAMVLGNLVIYILGVAWLSTVTGSVASAVTVGVVPFLVGDGVKVALAALLLPLAWHRAR